MLTPAEKYFAIERIIELDFVRATEAAALNTLQWLGKGDKEAADEAACDAIRGMFDLMDIQGEVVIGEGIKDNAPGIFKGEHLGTWKPGAIRFDIALDPVDGTTNCSKGAPNSISCLAAASPAEDVATSMEDIPSFYMMKLAYSPKVARYMRRTGIESVTVQNPVEETITAVAKILEKPVKDVVVLVMDRPRHEGLVKEIRRIGASLRMFGDGDIAAAIAPSLPDSGVDLYVGVGGSPEAVLAAAGVKCLGGDIQCVMWPRDKEEKGSAGRRRPRGESQSCLFRRRPGAREEHPLFGDGHQRQPVVERRHGARRHGHHALGLDAREHADDPVHHDLPQPRDEIDPPAQHAERSEGVRQMSECGMRKLPTAEIAHLIPTSAF